MASCAPFSLLLAFLCILPLCLFGADPDSLQDVCVADLDSPILINGYPCKNPSTATSNDFHYTGLTKKGNMTGIYNSTVTRAYVKTFPGLNTLGVSMIRVDLKKDGGIAPLHLHPRASELVVLIKGVVLVGFISTDKHYFHKTLGVMGEIFVLPKGLPHFLLNVGGEDALVFSFFDSQNAGFLSVPTNLFAAYPHVPNRVLRESFNVRNEVVEMLKRGVMDA